MGSVYKKEIRSYFSTVYAYIFIAIIIATAGIFFTLINLMGASANFEQTMDYVGTVFIITVPILTMRSYSEERSRSTEQLLKALPLKVSDIILGKYLALLSVFAIPSAFICVLPLVLSLFGKVNLAIAYNSILGFVLLGCALIAIGLFISAINKSQILSAIITFVFILLSFLLQLLSGALTYILPSSAFANVIIFTILALGAGAIVWLISKNLMVGMITAIAAEIPVAVLGIVGSGKDTSYMVNGFASFLSKLSLFSSFSTFLGGIFDLGAVVYYLGAIFIFTTLTIRLVDARRWN